MFSLGDITPGCTCRDAEKKRGQRIPRRGSCGGLKVRCLEGAGAFNRNCNGPIEGCGGVLPADLERVPTKNLCEISAILVGIGNLCALNI